MHSLRGFYATMGINEQFLHFSIFACIAFLYAPDAVCLSDAESLQIEKTAFSSFVSSEGQEF